MVIESIIDSEYKNSEIITSYKYTTALNIDPKDSVATILSTGPSYFRNRMLLGRPVVLPVDAPKPEFTLKSTSGYHLAVYKPNEYFSNKRQIEIPLDETGLYRVDTEGNLLYSVDELEFYDLGNGNMAVVVVDNFKQHIDDILQSDLYSCYDGSLPHNLVDLFKRHKIYKVTEEALVDLSIKQYASFKESLQYIVARIPAQSEQFAMPCDIVAMFDSPYNVSFVNLYQTYEQGSDYDVDKNNNLGIALTAQGVYPA